MKSYSSLHTRRAYAALPLTLIALAAGCGDGQTDQAAAAAGKSGETENEQHVVEGVHLSADQLQGLGIVVRPLEARSVTVLRRPATLRLDPDRVALVGPRVEAKVERVLKDLGEFVRAGEPLALMSSIELGGAKAEHLAAKGRLKARCAEYERERKLYEDRISSEAELLEAQARYEEVQAEVDAIHETLRLYGLPLEEIEEIEPGRAEPLSFFRLKSPVDGVVQRRDLSPGQTVGPSDTPILVARIDRLWLMIDAFERDISFLRQGQKVEFTVRSLPDRTFEAVTDWVSYELDPETRTVRVRAQAKNPDGVLRAGMFGTAGVQVEQAARYAAVPVDAVRNLDGRTVLFVPDAEPGRFRPVPVRLGEESDGVVEIVEGVRPGDSAVVAGAFELMSAATAATREADHH